KVCCFCGLTDYSPIGKERAQYDHYLHRSLYPLSTANGANLVPMCDRCNSMANKGQKDIIRKSGARRHAFFPYAPCSGVAVTARCLQPDRVQRNARWEVEVLPRTSAEREKVGTWLDVFRIKDRYQETLSTDSATWLQQQLSDWVESRSVKGVGNLRTFFRMKSQKLQEELPKTEKAIVMQAMFSHMASAQGSVLRGLIDNLQTAYASRSANRGKRTLTEQ
ncbi:MAG TPA: hypothetical protein VLT36_08870, partial [Candidatus Dormibacteraeota bacterium]|nr:hypothetical protein [Candidatus Dormibacteraeota bacterium]